MPTEISQPWSKVIVNFIFDFLGFLTVGHVHLVLPNFAVVKIVEVGVNMGIFPAFDPVVIVVQSVG